MAISMIIAIASGKGGTGKTTVATSLALSIAQPGLFLDCDVEEPNAALFLKPVLNHTEDVGILIPKVAEDRCTLCPLCRTVALTRSSRARTTTAWSHWSARGASRASTSVRRGRFGARSSRPGCGSAPTLALGRCSMRISLPDK